jgi:diguanylate cyclase (GGDEF)-like protein
MPRPSEYRLVTRRTFPAMAIAGIVLLAAFASWSAWTMTSAAQEVRRSTVQSDAFQSARYAVEEEASVARAYRLAPDPTLQQDLDRARRGLERALAMATSDGSAADRQVAARVLAMNDEALASIRRVIEATNKADANRANEIDTRSLTPILAAQQELLDGAAADHRRLALSSLHSSQRSERVMVVVTLVAFSLGVLLVLAVGKVLGVREQLERARQAEMDRLRMVALTDNLTGLLNHRSFHEDLAEALAGATASEPLSLVLLDLDGLKDINDRQGHQDGDECICGLADALRTATGEADGAYRIGGDEFALLLRGTRAIPALNLVQRMQGGLTRTPNGRRISASAGIAESTGSIDTDELIRRADLALINAKRNRRHGLIHSPTLEPSVAPVRSDRRETDVLASALARAVDAKDAYTHSHCETVSELCALIGHELGLEPDRVANLRTAGLLHDVGKIGIPDRILQKPQALTDEEFDVMKRHAQLGHEIVMAAERPIEAGWILHHHERIDGNGYPSGLAGEQIPLESRIILVADAFEAITADRPYRQHSSIEQALAELRRHAGSQFDPACVDALRRVIAGEATKAA